MLRLLNLYKYIKSLKKPIVQIINRFSFIHNSLVVVHIEISREKN